MEYEIALFGIGGIVLGVLLGVWLSPKMLYPMQKKLLEQQLEFQGEMARSDLEHREKMACDHIEIMKNCRSILREIATKLNKL